MNSMHNNTLSEEEVFVRVHCQDAEYILDRLRKALPGISCSGKAGGHQAMYRMLVTFDPPNDEPLGSYQHIHSTGAGVEAICAKIASLPNPPVITRTLGHMGRQMSEYCLGYSLAFLQRHDTRKALQTNRIWDREKASPRNLFNSKILIIGTGEMGCAIAKAYKYMGAEVTGLSRTGEARPYFDRIESFSRIPRPEVEIVAVVLPETPQTRGLIDEEFLSTLNNVLLINIGRGSVAFESDLKTSLEEGYVNQIVLDVFDEEPLPHSHWMWCHPKVVITPHVAGLTLRDDAVAAIVDQLEGVIGSGVISNSVDVSKGY